MYSLFKCYFNLQSFFCSNRMKDERIIIRRKCVRDYKRYATNTSAWVLNITSHLNEL